LVYTLTVSANNTAQTIALTDTLPMSLTAVRLRSGEATYDAPTHQVRYQGSVEPGAPLVLVYAGQVPDSIAPGTILSNMVEVRSTAEDLLLMRSTAVSIPDPQAVHTLLPMLVAVDNDLAVEGLALLNRAEQAADNPFVTALVWIDGPATGDSYLYRLQPDQDLACPNYINPTCDGRYVWGETIWAMPEAMADPFSVAEFLKGALTAYPGAEHVIPVFVGHGSGISANGLAAQPRSKGRQSDTDLLAGMLTDDNPAGTSLSTRSLGEALAWSLESARAAGIDRERYDGVFLDACLMGMVEVAYELRGSVDYMLAAQSIKWTTFPYDLHLNAIDGTRSVPDVLDIWLREEVNQVRNDSNHPYTYALVDLARIEPVRAAIDDLAAALIAVLPAEQTRIDAAFQQADCFDSDADGSIQPGSDNYCDLRTFAELLAAEFSSDAAIGQANQNIQAAVDAAVIAEASAGGTPWLYSGETWAWSDNLGGLSLYLPLIQDEWKRAFYSEGQFSLARDGQWDEFLSAYWPGEPPQPQPCPPACGEPQQPLPVNTDLPITVDTVPGYQSIALSWNTTNDPSISGYRVGRAISGTTSFAPVASVTQPFYTDSDVALTPETTYCYQVEAVQRNGGVVRTSQPSCTAPGELALWIPDTWAPAESTVQVPVNIRNADELRIGASNIWLDFDPTVLEPLDVQAAPLTEGSYTFRINTETPGRVQIVALSTDNPRLYGEGTLCRVTFRVRGAPDSTSLLNLREFIEGIGGSELYAYENPVEPVPLRLDDGIFRSSAAYRLGDLSGNGVVGAEDAAFALDIATSRRTPDSAQQQAGDVNGDGAVDAADAALILRYVVHEQQWPGSTSDTDAITLPILNLDAVQGAAGTAVQATLSAEGLTDWASGEFVIVYNTEMVQSIPQVRAVGAASDFALRYHDSGIGILQIAMASDQAISGDGPLVQIDIHLAPNIATGTASTLLLAEAALSDGVGRDFSSSALQRTPELRSAELRIGTVQEARNVYLPLVRR
jgi:hypothetical protein